MNWASTLDSGRFTCPNCDCLQSYRVRSSRPFLTVYFVPVFPIGGLETYVQCNDCKQAFEMAILNSQQQIASTMSSFDANITFEDDLLTLIALIMIEDGQVSEEEIRVARRLYENITSTNLSRDELGRRCSSVRLRRLNVMNFLSTCSKRRTHEEKLLFVQGMFGVAGAEGAIRPQRMLSLVGAQAALELEESEFTRAVESTSQWLA